MVAERPNAGAVRHYDRCVVICHPRGGGFVSIVAHGITPIDPAIRRARANHSPQPLGWKLAEPIAFVDSRDHPAVQLADVIAGTAAALFANGLPGCEAIAESIGRHCHPHSILPDMDIINPANRSAAVNALIVYDLAKRAERHGDPYENLKAMYRMAEVSWARGDYELIKKATRR